MSGWEVLCTWKALKFFLVELSSVRSILLGKLSEALLAATMFEDRNSVRTGAKGLGEGSGVVNAQRLCPQGKQWRRSMRQMSIFAGKNIRLKWTLSKRIGATGP